MHIVPTAMPEMLTIKALSEKSGISSYTLRNLCKTNQITYFKAGAKILINYPKFIQFLDGKQ